MKLIELTVNNFMPYRDSQQVTFPQDRHRNVMVVWGDNMRGKTSLLNALRWCFYGEAVDRDRNRLPLRLLANVDASMEGDWTFSVFVRFSRDGHTYDLRRVARLREQVSVPKNDADFDVEVLLTRDGNVVSGHLVEHELNQILPKQVSRFFLFDAELLLEYQELLVEDSEQGKRIRSAVEQVLGVPPIANGKTAFRTLLKKAQTILAKETEHTKGLEAQAEHFKKLQAEIDALTASQVELKQKEHLVKVEIAGLDAELSKTEAAQRAQARIDRLEIEKRTIADRTEQLRADRLGVVAGAWRDLLQPRLKVRLASLNEDLARYEGQLQETGALRERIRQLQAALAQSVCSVCGQAIAPAKRESHAADLGRLQADLSILEGSVPQITHVSNEILQLASLRGTGAAGRLSIVETELTRSAIKMTDCETSLEDIRKEVTGFDTAEVARLRSQQKQLHIHVGKLSEELQRVENDISTRAAKQNELSKLMSKGPSARTRRSAIEVQLYRALEDLFTGTIDELRDRLRTKVEEFASIAFGRLTTDQTYTGLQINESYGLTIVDRIKRPVPLRSAGAEQIVALSLIDGLNRTARRAAPIVMDTPLARLDLNHRAKVLAYLPEMAEQVVLLVHEGEIDKDDGLAPLAEHIGAVYEIDRVTSSFSKLTKIQG